MGGGGGGQDPQRYRQHNTGNIINVSGLNMLSLKLVI